MKPDVRAGAVAALIGVPLILGGLFGSIGSCARPDVPCPSPRWNEVAAYLGLASLVFGIGLLVWSGWRGSGTGWVLAAVAAMPATWFLYELGRQTLCPLITDPSVSSACLTAYGEMTAPVLSFAVGGILLALGWLRARQLRLRRDIGRR
jgi:hypothetical protein